MPWVKVPLPSTLIGGFYLEPDMPSRTYRKPSHPPFPTSRVSTPQHRGILCFTCDFPRSRRSSRGGKVPRDKFSAAMDSLHVTAVPKSLPCRTKEQRILLNFLTSNIKSGERRITLPFSLFRCRYASCKGNSC